jgi:glycosyltransferase involved in cell wall biosynthesis
MRIAVIHHFYDERNPSGENSLVRMQIEALLRAGHEVRLFETHGHEISDLRSKIVVSSNLLNGSGENFNDEIFSFNPHLVHVHNTFPLISLTNIAKLNYPKVMTLHNFRFVCASGTLSRDGNPCDLCVGKSKLSALKYKCYRNSILATIPLMIMQTGTYLTDFVNSFNRIIVVNSEIANVLARDGFTITNTKVLSNFVAEQVADQKSQNRTKFIYCGRITEDKGLPWLLARWPANVDRLEIFGTGPKEAELRAMYRGNVEFFGHIERSLLLAKLPNYKALILPSLWSEGSPMVALEALSFGIPVLAHKNSAIGLLIDQEGAGIAFDSKESLVAAINELEKNYESYAAKANIFFAANFSEKSWIKETESIYQEAIENFHSG